MLYVLFLLEAALTVVHFLNCDLPCLFVRLRLWSLSYVVNVYEWLWVFQWMRQLRHTKADFVVFFLYLYVRIKWKTWCNLCWFIYCKLWCNGKDMWRTDDDTPREADQPDRFFFHWTCLYVCLTSKYSTPLPPLCHKPLRERADTCKYIAVVDQSLHHVPSS